MVFAENKYGAPSLGFKKKNQPVLIIGFGLFTKGVVKAWRLSSLPLHCHALPALFLKSHRSISALYRLKVDPLKKWLLRMIG